MVLTPPGCFLHLHVCGHWHLKEPEYFYQLHRLICKHAASAFISSPLFCSVIELQPGLKSVSSFSGFQHVIACNCIKIIGQGVVPVFYEFSEFNKGIHRVCIPAIVHRSTQSHTHIHTHSKFLSGGVFIALMKRDSKHPNTLDPHCTQYLLFLKYLPHCMMFISLFSPPRPVDYKLLESRE